MRYRKSNTALYLLLIVAPVVCSQSPDSLWLRTYGGDSSNIVRQVRPTGDGGYVFAGHTQSLGSGGYDFWLARTDADGSLLTSSACGGSGDDICAYFQPAADGGFALCGSSLTPGADYYDGWFLKTDPDGDSLWSRTFGGVGPDMFSFVHQTPDGGYFLAGTTSLLSMYSQEFYLVRLDASGDTLWTRTYGGLGMQRCHAATVVSDGSYVLVGDTGSSPLRNLHWWVLKVSADGDSLWSRICDEGINESCTSVLETADGGLLLLGQSQYFRPGVFYPLVIRTNSDGGWIWMWSTPNDRLRLNSAVETSGGFILAGHTPSIGRPDDDFLLLKLDVVGDSVWSRTYGSDQHESFTSIRETADGFILGGTARDLTSEFSEAVLMKTGPENTSVPNPSPCTLRNFDFTNYPNPFNDLTRFYFSLPAPAKIRLEIFDITGRRIATPAEDYYPAGSHLLAFYGNSLPSGIYFARLETAGSHQNRKIIHLK